jgi:predicted O-methyltransferase YrrM
MDEFPPLVARACALARQIGFPLTREESAASGGGPWACLPGVGRFLAVLAAGLQNGRIGEIGTGTGVGAAWMTWAMPADCALVTVEIDERRAATARALLEADRRVTVLTGDAWGVLPAHSPFDLLFADGPWQNPAGPASLVDLVKVGGQIVMDDVIPLAALAAGQTLRPHEVKRALFFGDPRLVSTEVVLPDLRNALLVGTRRA